MITIGRIARNRRASKFNYAMACVAKMHDVQFFYFVPSDIDYETKTIEGSCYENGEWVKKTFPYPDYLYDRYLMRGRSEHKMYEEFAHIPFNNENPMSGSLNKTEMYRLLESNPKVGRYLIPYEPIETIDQVINALNEFNKIICKAENGNRGLSVQFIEKHSNHYLVKIHDEEVKMDLEMFTQHIKQSILDDEDTYILQPFIVSKTKTGNPFDIRVHLMKDEKGEWSIARMYPRIGQPNTIVSNFHLGGTTCQISHFFQRQMELTDYRKTRRQIRSMALRTAKHIEKEVEYQFSEIGLDVAIDENERLWLFEANMHMPSVRYLTIEAAHHAIVYGKHVALQQRLEQAILTPPSQEELTMNPSAEKCEEVSKDKNTASFYHRIKEVFVKS